MAALDGNNTRLDIFQGKLLLHLAHGFLQLPVWSTGDEDTRNHAGGEKRGDARGEEATASNQVPSF